ncbi:MAG: sigma-70 family RNA polymerase sigma factor [Hyphomicrobiaceae bacterium]|nr:sigma-70 family RNA polymerase sigma factor [Hyphomicrobiaceae bacterium]
MSTAQHDVDGLQHDLARLIPNLRAFARSLCGSADQADDLVQETLVKAWNSRASFQPGSNLKAWLFTILRNAFLSERRKRKWEVQDVDGIGAGMLCVRAAQHGHMDMIDFEKAFATLPADQKEALLLIGAEGFSYDEAALMCGCALGTMKSRVNRARTRLARELGLDAASYDILDPHIGTGQLTA